MNILSSNVSEEVCTETSLSLDLEVYTEVEVCALRSWAANHFRIKQLAFESFTLLSEIASSCKIIAELFNFHD
jgi:hypothetical protein